ncbi:MAG: fibronectin type III domain-containing protein [Lachnospiraceae bacterium]
MKVIKSFKIGLSLILLSLLCIVPACNTKAATIQNGGSNLSNAKAFSVGTTLTGSFDGAYAPAQYFKFTLSGNTCIKIDVQTKTSSQKCYVRLKDSSGKQIEFMYTEDEKNWGYQSATLNIALSAGTYYFQVEPAVSEKTCYTINTSVSMAESASVKIGGQNNCYFNTAVNFSIGNKLYSIANEKCNGMNWDDNHIYKFTLSSTKTVCFRAKKMNTSKEFLWVTLYDKNGNKMEVKDLCEKDIFSSATTDPWVWDVTKKLSAGTYYIGVSTTDCYIPYTIYTSTVPGKTADVKVKSTGKKTLKVTWKKSTCSGYEVQYCKKKNFKGSKVYKKSITNSTSYSKKGLSSKTKYYVRVRSYNKVGGKKVYGSWSAVKSVKIK